MIKNSKFTKDIGWKLLSLIIAVGLWFTVINTENPLESRSYTASIQLQNQESLFDRGYVVVNEDELTSLRVTVKLRGQRLALDNLSKSSTKVQAIVDLENVIYSYDGNPITVPVSIVIPSVVNNSFEILSKSIQSVSIDLQPYVNSDFEIQPVVQYDAAGSQELINAVASPASVTAYGAKSIINSISSVKAVVSVGDLSDDTVLTASPVAYDADGNVLKNVTFSVNEISVKVSMDDMKNVQLASDIDGVPSDGYGVSEIYISPDNIDVAGSENALKSFEKIVLPSVDVTDATSDVVKQFALSDYLPEGIRIIDSTNTIKYVTVTVMIEENSEKTITLSAESISDNGTTPEGKIVKIDSGYIDVTISGIQSVINDITEDDIKAYVDLSEYEEGTYDDVLVQFDLPDGVTLVQDDPKYVTVTLS